MSAFEDVLDDGAVARVTYLEHDGDGVHSVVTPSGAGYGFPASESEGTESKSIRVESSYDARFFDSHRDFAVEWLDGEAEP